MVLLSVLVKLFQSTPPAKGATISAPLIFVISLFQSTPPAKGATDYPQQRQAAGDISIHAPREGGDPTPIHITNVLNYFNPRPP